MERAKVLKIQLQKERCSTSLNLIWPWNLLEYLARGTSFPDWLGDSNLYRNLVDVFLHGCETCVWLPTLGQLSSLKRLYISGFGSLENIGSEFYKNNTNDKENDNGGKWSLMTPPFPCLERLSFYDMVALRRWLCYEAQPHSVAGVIDVAFPKLKYLSMVCCPQLVDDWPTRLPALEELQIAECDAIVSIEISNLLKRLEIGECRSLECLTLSKVHHESLKSFSVQGCQSLVQMPPLDAFPNLNNFEIWECECLESLSTVTKVPLELLQSFDIYSCKSLVCMPAIDEAFPNLRSLGIEDCESLSSLSITKAPLKHLQSINIEYCPNLVPDFFNSRSSPSLDGSGLPSLQIGSLFPSLRKLDMGNCGGRCFDFHGMDWQQMQKLGLIELGIGCRCDNMEYCSFATNGEGSSSMLPPSLKELLIQSFSSVKTLNMAGLQHLTCLETLRIINCPKLESHPELQSLPASLKQLYIKQCSSLKVLDMTGLQQLTSLQSLEIWGCSGLESITELKRLPHSLQSLEIGYCESLTSLELEGLQHLTSLTDLRIDDCPLLSEEYKRKQVDIMPNLTHIQKLRVDGLPKRWSWSS